MKKQSLLFILSVLLSLFAVLPLPSLSQLVLGQYEDEAPLRTWNQYGFLSATSTAMGGTRFAYPIDCSASLSNPALLPLLAGYNFSINASYSSTSLFKYSIVNTGVVTSSENLSLRLYALDFAGISVRWKDWAVSVSQALTEIYERPAVEQKVNYQGNPYYIFNFSQGGELKTTHFALARRMSNCLSVGLGFNYIHGSYEKNVQDEWLFSNITITDDKSGEWRGYYLNGGVWIAPTDHLFLAVVFRTPYIRKAESVSSFRYISSQGDTDISIDAASENEYKQPLVLGLGLNYQFTPALRLESDFTFFNWSNYKITYYQEEIERKFKNIIQVGVGLEYLNVFNLFGQTFLSPLRVGLMYDPQPMQEPRSSYFYITVGTGLHWRNFVLDAGVFVGQEKGSGDSLRARKLSLSLSFIS